MTTIATKLRTRVRRPPRAPRTVVVLLDLENLRMQPRTEALAALLAPIRDTYPRARLHLVAACNESTRETFAPMCATADVTLLPAAGTSSAADKVLLGVAAAARAVDRTVPVVACSADRAFAAADPSLVVLPAGHDGQVAKQLLECGSRLLFVAVPRFKTRSELHREEFRARRQARTRTRSRGRVAAQVAGTVSAAASA